MDVISDLDRELNELRTGKWVRIQVATLEAREKSAVFMQRCQKLAAPYGGKLTCWVDQRNDAGQIANRMRVLFPDAMSGVCLSLAFAWIRAGARGERAAFRLEMTAGISSVYRAQQATHAGYTAHHQRNRAQIAILAERYKKALRDLPPAKSESKTASSAPQTKTATATTTSVTSTVSASQAYARVILDDLHDEFRRAVAAANALITEQYTRFATDGSAYAPSGENDDAVSCASLFTVLKTQLAHRGLYLVHLHGGTDGDHAVAFESASDGVRFFDANSGELEFATAAKLLEFFAVYWKEFYAADFKAARFRMVTYRVVPSLSMFAGMRLC
jgi:hypothetical protein